MFYYSLLVSRLAGWDCPVICQIQIIILTVIKEKKQYWLGLLKLSSQTFQGKCKGWVLHSLYALV